MSADRTSPNPRELYRHLDNPPAWVQRLVPEGEYCYRVVAHEAGARVIKRCPFLQFQRPDTLCLLDPLADWVFAVDACKGCGINQTGPDEADWLKD